MGPSTPLDQAVIFGVYNGAVTQEPATDSVRSFRWAYSGPSLTEWLASLACTVMIGSSMRSLAEMDQPMTAASYYSKAPGMALLQFANIGISLAFMALVLAWIITRKNTFPLLWLLFSISALGIGLIWTELFLALRQDKFQVYALTELPYKPIAGGGIVGAQILLTYLIFKLPDGQLKIWQGLLLKAAFSLGAWALQTGLWDLLSRRSS